MSFKPRFPTLIFLSLIYQRMYQILPSIYSFIRFQNTYKAFSYKPLTIRQFGLTFYSLLSTVLSSSLQYVYLLKIRKENYFTSLFFTFICNWMLSHIFSEKVKCQLTLCFLEFFIQFIDCFSLLEDSIEQKKNSKKYLQQLQILNFITKQMKVLIIIR